MKVLNILNHMALNATADAEQGIGELIRLDFSRVSEALKHMGVGMLSIFIVIGVIILLIHGMNKIMSAIGKKNKKNTEE